MIANYQLIFKTKMIFCNKMYKLGFESFNFIHFIF